MKRINNIQKLFQRRKELRNNATKEERVLWGKLKHSKLGVKFRRQHSIGGYIVDFYCPEKKLVIEIDGLQHLGNNDKEYDKNRTNFFKSFDINVIRFTNIEIDNDMENVISKITTIL